MDANAALGDLAPLIAIAARGNLGAQRAMSAYCLKEMNGHWARGYRLGATMSAVEAMFWARLAASQGNADDANDLATALGYLSDFLDTQSDDGEGNELLTESISILDRLATSGDERAAASLNRVVGLVSPSVAQRAQAMSKELAGAE